MTRAGTLPERRSQARRPVRAERVSWAQADATRTRAGWLSDAADSSIAFVTPTRDQPAPGQTLELTTGINGPSPQLRRVRVVRAVPYDRFFSIVGCMNELTEVLAQTTRTTATQPAGA